MMRADVLQEGAKGQEESTMVKNKTGIRRGYWKNTTEEGQIYPAQLALY